jgi:lipopolysaccharide transport system ATP-binding protein
MCSDEVVIRVQGVGKGFQIYEKASDRLKQFIWPRIQRLVGQPAATYFREFWALKGVSFEVKRGETVGIIGRNGSGKSTLLQIICGTLHPSVGDVRIEGRVAALLELGSGFDPEFTGRENVYLNAGVLGLTRSQTEQRFKSIETFADIGEFIDQPVKTYSSGMMVRLAFAVIAHVDADILVIDEALAVGDAFFTQKCMRFLREFMGRGTVLFVSHDTAAVMNLCSRAVWLEHGKVVQDGNPKEVSEDYLKAYYESQQGASTANRIKPVKAKVVVEIEKQSRLPSNSSSNLQNGIEMVPFDPHANSFGKGGATISSAEFLDASNRAMNWVVGGEMVCLEICVDCHQALASPIVGFTVKDRLGQGLFGDNTSVTFLGNPQSCDGGSRLSARFSFEMPRLAAGDYSVTVAVADGTQEDHIQHHWMHDALLFKSVSTSVAAGLIGIPMRSIELSVVSAVKSIDPI